MEPFVIKYLCLTARHFCLQPFKWQPASRLEVLDKLTFTLLGLCGLHVSISLEQVYRAYPVKSHDESSDAISLTWFDVGSIMRRRNKFWPPLRNIKLIQGAGMSLIQRACLITFLCEKMATLMRRIRANEALIQEPLCQSCFQCWKNR